MHKTALITAAVIAATASALPAAAATATEAAPARAAVMFWLLDRNGDGTIDRSEVEAVRAAAFDALDRNHDGVLTRDEVDVSIDAARARIADRLADVVRHGPARAADREQRILARLGLDGPAAVAKNEFVKRDPRLFARADRNGDGKISKDEFEATASDGFAGALMPE